MSSTAGSAQLRAFGIANATIGAERNRLKTEVIHCEATLEARPKWQLDEVREQATVSAAPAGAMTLQNALFTVIEASGAFLLKLDVGLSPSTSTRFGIKKHNCRSALTSSCRCRCLQSGWNVSGSDESSPQLGHATLRSSRKAPSRTWSRI